MYFSIKSQPFKLIFWSLLGGVIMGLTPAPLNLWYLAWIALIPLWIIVRKSKSIPILPALTWGFGYHGLALFWITGIHPMTWMGVPWLSSLLIAILCWLLITLWGTLIVIIWSTLFYFLTKNKLQKSLLNNLLIVGIGVAIWCCLETLWSYTDLWWSSLSYTQSPHNLAILQLLQFSGPNTITALIVGINGLLAENLLLDFQPKLNQFWRKNPLVIIAISIYLTAYIIGYNLYTNNDSSLNQKPFKVGIIQGNIPNEIKLYPEGWRKAIEGYTTGYETLAQQQVDFIITPETALPFYYEEIQASSTFYQALKQDKIPTFLGAFGEKEGNFTNSLFLLNGEGKIISRYDKINLVPVGEYIPFASILGNIINRLSPLDAHLVAGTKNQIFSTPFGQAIVAICYDSAYSEHFRHQTAMGGEFIITAANNAHYSPSMPSQHHAQDVMRAIETDRWLARATNTGYSAIIASNGKTIWQSTLNTYQIHADTIYSRQTKTLYVKWGDWLTKIMLLFLGVYMFKFKIN
jgi:apolipoprotein N-acyltransferase